jgi:hypothetical protein
MASAAPTASKVRIGGSSAANLPPGSLPPPTYAAPNSFRLAEDQRRIKDVEAARSIYGRFVQDSLLRSATIAATRNQLEGGLPFNPKDLEEQGAAWQTNVNFGDAQAARDRTLIPYWAMVHDVPHKVAVTIDTDSPKKQQWEIAHAECFDEWLKDWGADYFIEFMNMASNFVNFGPGAVHWDDPDCPRFDAVNTQRLYFPKNARMSPDSWDVWCFVKDTSPSELYLKVKDATTKKTSHDSGWNIDAVEAAIVQTMYGNSGRDPRDYTRWQDDLVQNDITVASIFEPTQLVWMFVRQFDGKITCHVFTRAGGVSDFLFESQDFAESMRQVLGCVWYDVGVDSLIHSIKGFGIKNYNFAITLNRMKSRMVDAATMAFGLNLYRTSGDSPDEAPPVENYGPYTVFPQGFAQFQFYPQIQQGMGVIDALDQNRAENSAQYRQQQQKQIAESDTATQANILANESGQMTQASASIFLAQVGENIFGECMRRLCKKGNRDKDAKKFIDRLVRRGVPKAVIGTLDMRVQTGANAGLASSQARMQKYQALMAMINQPGVNARYVIELVIGELLGSDGISRALLPPGTNSAPADRRVAKFENSLFGQGIETDVDPNDAHFEHLQEHLKAVGPIGAQFQQAGQISPEATVALITTLQHCATHIQLLKQDETMKAQYQQVWPIFSQLQSIARGLIVQLQKQQNQGQPGAPQPNGRPPVSNGNQTQQAQPARRGLPAPPVGAPLS